MFGFGQTGAAVSRQYAFQACSICGAPIRISLFLVMTFLLQLAGAVNGGFHGWRLLMICGQQGLLILTVLCHEFGHGTAARAVGGGIDHILLWPFGGICFTSRPLHVTDPQTITRHNLLITAAGPATHFLMVPIWALLLGAYSTGVGDGCHGPQGQECTSCAGADCVWEFLTPMADGPYVYEGQGVPFMGEAAALFWQLLGFAIKINVMLFLFNVFFPMYPADGSKLLTAGLMQCGMSAHNAATVLIYCTAVCAGLLLFHAMSMLHHHNMRHLKSLQGGMNDGGMASMSVAIVGFMGVMSLMEAWKLHELQKQGQLHQHPLFPNARSQTVAANDGRGAFNRINDSENDDPNNGCGCCNPSLWWCPQSPRWCSTCPTAPAQDDGDAGEAGGYEDNTAPSSASGGGAQRQQRQQRDEFLRSLETDQANRNKTIRQLEDERRGT